MISNQQILSQSFWESRIQESTLAGLFWLRLFHKLAIKLWARLQSLTDWLRLVSLLPSSPARCLTALSSSKAVGLRLQFLSISPKGLLMREHLTPPMWVTQRRERVIKKEATVTFMTPTRVACQLLGNNRKWDCRGRLGGWLSQNLADNIVQFPQLQLKKCGLGRRRELVKIIPQVNIPNHDLNPDFLYLRTFQFSN